MSFFCYKCGQGLPDDARFCMKCGTAVIMETVSAEAEEEISTEYRDNIYKELSDFVLARLDTGEISVVDARDSAQFITSRLDSVHTQRELTAFLQQLAQKWPVYETVVQEIQEK